MTDNVGLGGVYDATLGRIKGQGGEKARLGMATLMWITHSERPLNPNELCHALAIEIGLPNFDAENIPSVGFIVACCQGLVTVDKEASTVRLIHFTVQEYLLARPELFSSAHSTIAETCLSYLNCEQIKALSASPDSNLEDSNLEDSDLEEPDPRDSDLEDSKIQSTTFLQYSSLYWGIHAKRDLSDCAKLLALKLFSDFNNHISIEILLKAQEIYEADADFDYLSLFSRLHCASFFGIVEIVASLVEVEDCDINQGDCIGNTPLALAAWNGHEEVVEILLGRDDVSPDKPDRFGRTPLGWAASSGREGVVNILLGHDDVNPDTPDTDGITPLWEAARNGHEGAVKILLGRDGVNPDKQDFNGYTPLWAAALDGHEGVVKILLEQTGVNPNTGRSDGRTPLWAAAHTGNEGVVKILLGRDDVNPNKPSDDTPLSCAAWNGDEGVVKILLQRDDVNPDQPDKSGRTPFWYASERGHAGVAALLQPLAFTMPSPPQSGETIITACNYG